ncbi:MAG TPA: hypothetical protein VF490_11500 [Chryseosolibacter sp.]
MKIKKNPLSLLIVFNILSVPYAGHGQDKNEITPFRFSEKKVIQGEEGYSYYALSDKSATTYRIEGPGKLYINSRVAMTERTSKSKASAMKIVQSEELVKTYRIPELPVDSLKSIEKNFSSKLHRVAIDVPPGSHSYRIYSTDPAQRVYVRGFYKAYAKPVWAELSPATKLQKKEVRFVTSKTTQPYYELTKKDGFRFEISDTSQLRIIVRPSFSDIMLDDAKITLSIMRNNGQEHVYKFSSRRANDVEFVNDSASIPGKSSTFYVELPKPTPGRKDTYDVRLVRGAKSVVVRISTNKKLKK